MGLVDLRTNLKSLRYGKDTVGGGNSSQPFVTRAIPDDLSDVGRTGGPDFLLRGGSLLPRIVLNDASRVSQLFYPGKGDRINNTNTDNPLGIDASNNGRRPINLIGTLFTAKQNILSLTNVNSSAGYEPFVQAERDVNGNFFQRAGSAISTFIQNNVALNQGIYTPLSTIGQTVGGALGAHLNKQGINPLQNTTIGSEDGNTPLGLPTYLNTIATGGDEGNKSRLLPLLSKIDSNTDGDQTLYKYSGGPGATLGVGQTVISMQSEYRTGENNAKKQYWKDKITPQFVDRAKINAPNILKNSLIGIFNKRYDEENLGFVDGNESEEVLFSTLFQDIDIGLQSTRFASVYQSGTLLETNKDKLASGINESVPRQVWTQAEIENKTPFSKTGKTDDIKDFRKVVSPDGSSFSPDSIPYTDVNKFEQRVNLGNPGIRANRQSYTIGRRDLGNDDDSVLNNSGYDRALDKINALPIYQSGAVEQSDKVKNDFVKFRIGVIQNDRPNIKNYIHFRAIIDSMDDSYASEWKAQKYMGRGENFYKYAGFDRTINLSWTVAAQSKQELIPMYQKLNYLASANAPHYSPSGYMGGNLISLTIGGWCYEQVGIMNGLTLSVPEESPWEISIPDAIDSNQRFSDDESQILTDPSVKEMPMIVKVTGFTFKPIHNFVPQIQDNDFAEGAAFGGGNFIKKYGDERYIALNNSNITNNYRAGDKHFNYIPKSSE